VKHQEIRDKFLKFFESKGHAIVPSSSLLSNDPSVLFTTAGMQQFKPYYIDPSSAPAKSIVSIQKCMRTSDVDEVGDAVHLTFFEMLGNFSFGEYGKREAIHYAHEFVTKIMGLKIDYVTVFAGHSEDDTKYADSESQSVWNDEIDHTIQVKKVYGTDNFWGPTGNEGPCGPTTEIYVNGIEIWNIVFNQYYRHKDGQLSELKFQGIDTGMGLERLAMVAQKKDNIFETDLFEPLIQILPGEGIPVRVHRIIADHCRAVAFLISDGVIPSNKEQGYVLRRLMRRVIVQCHLHGIELEAIQEIFEKMIELYREMYPGLNLELVKSVFEQENQKFQKTLKTGLKELEKTETVDAPAAFKLFESYGLPFEIVKEVAGDKAAGLNREDFEEERKRHQEISRAGAEKKFGGHGIAEGDDFRKTRLHTATHVLAAALEKVLGQKIQQNGSDITVERLRFDFQFSRKITSEELKQTEEIANEIVRKNLSVSAKEMPLKEALDSGAGAFFKMKYPERVKVYTIGDESDWFSKELCGGPHVSHTAEIGRITITKEESVSGGNRRIRATVD